MPVTGCNSIDNCRNTVLWLAGFVDNAEGKINSKKSNVSESSFFSLSLGSDETAKKICD
jgi:hypothetical protein